MVVENNFYDGMMDPVAADLGPKTFLETYKISFLVSSQNS